VKNFDSVVNYIAPRNRPIRSRAIEFSQEWQGARREASDKQTFYNEFFNVFGIRRQRVAAFEEAVKKLSNKQGFIDLFSQSIPFKQDSPCIGQLLNSYGYWPKAT
jgi:hypothetical protein